jgi:hypothetical protein
MTTPLDNTVISAGMHNDLKLCLQQALEYLESGKHDGDRVILNTIDVECLLELAEAVVDWGCKELDEKCKQGETSPSIAG